MSHFATATDYRSVAAITIFFAVLFLLGAGLVGNCWRRPWLERQALGLLVLMGGADLAYYGARWLELPLAGFAVLALLLILLLTASIRVLAFSPSETLTLPSSDGLVWPLFLALAALLLALRLETPFPQSGYSIFQALYPGYIQHSLLIGFPPDAAHTPMGRGFFLSNHLNYPADTLGLALLTAWMAGGAEHLIQPIYLASTAVPGVAAIGLMLHGLRRSRPALVAGLVLALAFMRFDNPLRLVLLDNWIDNVLTFSAAVTLFYLVAGESRRTTCRGAALAAAFMVFSRPYGAVFATVIIVPLFLAEMSTRLGQPRPYRLLSWLGIGLIFAIFNARELFLVLTSGIFHAQPSFAQQPHASVLQTWVGTLYDWRLLPDRDHFMLPVPSAVFALAGLVALGWRYRRTLRRRPGRLLVYLSPLLFLLGPLLVELITGYRRGFGNASKLYLVTVFLFPFYPALLMSRLGRSWPGILNHRDPILPRLAWTGGILVSTALAVMLIGPWSGTVQAKADSIIATYSRNNPDLQMGLLVDRALGAAGSEVSKQKILFLYHEPGFGLRYFIGGDVLADYDFFGERVQREISAGSNLEKLLQELGYPSIWLSYSSWQALGTFIGIQNGWEKVADEINRLTTESAVVKCIFQMPNAALIMTQPPTIPIPTSPMNSKNCAD